METLDPLGVLTILIIVFASVLWFIVPFIRGLNEKRHFSRSNRKSNELLLTSPSQGKPLREANTRFAISNHITRLALKTKRTIATKFGYSEASQTKDRSTRKELIFSPTEGEPPSGESSLISGQKNELPIAAALTSTIQDDSRKEACLTQNTKDGAPHPDKVPVLQPFLNQLSHEDIAIAVELSQARKKSKEDYSELLQKQIPSQDSSKTNMCCHIRDDESPEKGSLISSTQDKSRGAESPLSPNHGESSGGDDTTIRGFGNKPTLVNKMGISKISTTRYYKFPREASLTSLNEQNDYPREVSLAPVDEKESPRQSNTRSMILNYIRDQVFRNKSTIAHNLGIPEEQLVRECVEIFSGEKLSQDQCETVNDRKFSTEESCKIKPPPSQSF
ncbi:MAG: hypothetical protein WC647_19035 [Desulfomonilaceae bacterium]|jgi:hypothetical protein